VREGERKWEEEKDKRNTLRIRIRVVTALGHPTPTGADGLRSDKVSLQSISPKYRVLLITRTLPSHNLNSTGCSSHLLPPSLVDGAAANSSVLLPRTPLKPFSDASDTLPSLCPSDLDLSGTPGEASPFLNLTGSSCLSGPPHCRDPPLYSVHSLDCVVGQSRPGPADALLWYGVLHTSIYINLCLERVLCALYVHYTSMCTE
jgi:hypothetical protein